MLTFYVHFLFDPEKNLPVFRLACVLLCLASEASLSAKSFVYVTNCCTGGSSISIIDNVTSSQRPGVPMTGSGVAATVNPGGTVAYAVTQQPNALASINVATRQIHSSTSLNGQPLALAVSPNGNIVYVAECDAMDGKRCESSSISVRDASTLSERASIPLPQGTPASLALGTLGRQLFVTVNPQLGTLSPPGIVEIDTGAAEVQNFIPLPGTQPLHIAVKPSGFKLYISDTAINSVREVDSLTGEIVSTIRLSDSPTGLALSHDASNLFVAGRNMVVISTATNSIRAKAYVDLSTGGIAVSTDNKHCYVVDSYQSTLVTYDVALQQIVSRTTTGFRPTTVAVTPDGSESFVAASGSSTISQIDTDTNTVVAQAEAGSEPYGIVTSPDGQFTYVSNFYSSNVSVIETSTMQRVANIPTGYIPTRIAISPNGERIYVSNYDATITVIDTQSRTVVTNIVAAPGGSTSAYGLVVSPDGETLYALTSYGAFNGVLEIDTQQNAIRSSIPVRGEIADIAVSPDGLNAYITGNSNQTYIISVDLVRQRQAPPIPAYQPLGIVISPDGRYIYTGSTQHPVICVIDRIQARFVSGTPAAGTLGIALNAAGTLLYATGPDVTVFDTGTSQVLADVQTGGASVGVALH